MSLTRCGRGVRADGADEGCGPKVRTDGAGEGALELEPVAYGQGSASAAAREAAALRNRITRRDAAARGPDDRAAPRLPLALAREPAAVARPSPSNAGRTYGTEGRSPTRRRSPRIRVVRSES